MGQLQIADGREASLVFIDFTKQEKAQKNTAAHWELPHTVSGAIRRGPKEDGSKKKKKRDDSFIGSFKHLN
jgi:hypothetical protein